MLSRTLTLLLLAGIILQAQQQVPSPEREAQMGAQLASEVRHQTPPVPSAAVQEFVQHLGEHLAQQLPQSNLTYRFTVVRGQVGDPTHEPLAVPGGYIFIPASLLLSAQDEDEFAGMLAHALVHAVERHGITSARRGNMAQLSSIPLIFVGGWTGNDNAPLMPLGWIPTRRAQERQADIAAVSLMSRTGYDPAAFSRYIGRTQPDDSGNPQLEKYSLHAARAVRVAALDQAIGQLPERTYASHGDFSHWQNEVRQVEQSMAAQDPPSLQRTRRY